MFSVLIPVFNVAAYVEESVRSVLDQDFADLRLIVVDDASTDGTADVVHRLSSADHRLKLVRLHHNGGPGHARNVAMEHARSSYIMFLDGDDALDPGALTRIFRRLRETDHPDLLLLNHVRTYETRAPLVNTRTDVLTSLEGRATAAQRPEVLTTLNVAWNKVYSREFLFREHLHFPDGFYEDLPWSFAALLTARSIAAAPDVYVRYRQQRVGSRLATRSSQHLDVVKQWRRIMHFQQSRPELGTWGVALFDHMSEQYLTVLRHPERLEPGDAERFLSLAVEQLRRSAPDAERADTRVAELHAEHGRYLASLAGGRAHERNESQPITRRQALRHIA